MACNWVEPVAMGTMIVTMVVIMSLWYARHGD